MMNVIWPAVGKGTDNGPETLQEGLTKPIQRVGAPGIEPGISRVWSGRSQCSRKSLVDGK